MNLYTLAKDLQPGELVYVLGRQRTVKAVKPRGELVEVWTEEASYSDIFFPHAQMKYV